MADEAKKKHIDNVPSLADYLAPWETAAGETEIDKGKLKKYIHGLVSDAAKRADRAEEAEAKVATAEKDASDAKAELAKNDSTGKITQLETELAEAKRTGAKDASDLLRIKVGDEAGLTIKQSLRLAGETEDELKADAEELVKDFGVKARNEETDEEREEREEREEEEAEEEGGLLRSPRLRNPADSRDRETGGDQNMDIDKIVAGFETRLI